MMPRSVPDGDDAWEDMDMLALEGEAGMLKCLGWSAFCVVRALSEHACRGTCQREVHRVTDP